MIVASMPSYLWGLPDNLHNRCLRSLQKAQRGHAELSVNGRCPGSAMQLYPARTDSGYSRIDVAKIVFDEYFDEKVTYDINTRYSKIRSST